MSLLLRLYPRAWRERYGEELGWILEQRRMRARDVPDLLLSALDAHLRGGTVGGRGVAWRPPRRERAGGLAALAAGPLWMLTFAAALRRDTPGEVGLALVTVTLVLFVLALGLPLAGRPWRTARAAALIPALLGVAMLVGGLAALLALGDEPPGLPPPYAAWMAGGLVTLPSLLLLGVVGIASRRVAVGTAGLLVAGALVQVAAVFLADRRHAEWQLIVGAAAFGACWMVLGARLALRRAVRAT